MSAVKIYQPVAWRGNPTRLRSLMAKIKLLSRSEDKRDGDILETVMSDYAEMLEGKRQQPSLGKEKSAD